MNMMQYQYVAQSWFKRFQSGNFDVKDAPRSSRSITGKIDEIMEKVEQDRHISSHDIDKKLNINHKTVLNRLEKDGYKKNVVCVPHGLSEKFNGSYFHLGIIAKTEQNQTIFETAHYAR